MRDTNIKEHELLSESEILCYADNILKKNDFHSIENAKSIIQEKLKVLEMDLTILESAQKIHNKQKQNNTL